MLNITDKLLLDYNLFSLKDPKTTKFYVDNLDWLVCNFPYFKDLKILTMFFISKNTEFDEKFAKLFPKFLRIIEYNEKLTNENRKQNLTNFNKNKKIITELNNAMDEYIDLDVQNKNASINKINNKIKDKQSLNISIKNSDLFNNFLLQTHSKPFDLDDNEQTSTAHLNTRSKSFNSSDICSKNNTSCNKHSSKTCNDLNKQRIKTKKLLCKKTSSLTTEDSNSYRKQNNENSCIKSLFYKDIKSGGKTLKFIYDGQFPNHGPVGESFTSNTRIEVMKYYSDIVFNHSSKLRITDCFVNQIICKAKEGVICQLVSKLIKTTNILSFFAKPKIMKRILNTKLTLIDSIIDSSSSENKMFSDALLVHKESLIYKFFKDGILKGYIEPEMFKNIDDVQSLKNSSDKQRNVGYSIYNNESSVQEQRNVGYSMENTVVNKNIETCCSDLKNLQIVDKKMNIQSMTFDDKINSVFVGKKTIQNTIELPADESNKTGSVDIDLIRTGSDDLTTNVSADTTKFINNNNFNLILNTVKNTKNQLQIENTKDNLKYLVLLITAINTVKQQPFNELTNAQTFCKIVDVINKNGVEIDLNLLYQAVLDHIVANNLYKDILNNDLLHKDVITHLIDKIVVNVSDKSGNETLNSVNIDNIVMDILYNTGISGSTVFNGSTGNTVINGSTGNTVINGSTGNTVINGSTFFNLRTLPTLPDSNTVINENTLFDSNTVIDSSNDISINNTNCSVVDNSNNLYFQKYKLSNLCNLKKYISTFYKFPVFFNLLNFLCMSGYSIDIPELQFPVLNRFSLYYFRLLSYKKDFSSEMLFFTMDLFYKFVDCTHVLISCTEIIMKADKKTLLDYKFFEKLRGMIFQHASDYNKYKIENSLFSFVLKIYNHYKKYLFEEYYEDLLTIQKDTSNTTLSELVNTVTITKSVNTIKSSESVDSITSTESTNPIGTSESVDSIRSSWIAAHQLMKYFDKLAKQDYSKDLNDTLVEYEGFERYTIDTLLSGMPFSSLFEMEDNVNIKD